jgi:hypothetical protein
VASLKNSLPKAPSIKVPPAPPAPPVYDYYTPVFDLSVIEALPNDEEFAAQQKAKAAEYARQEYSSSNRKLEKKRHPPLRPFKVRYYFRNPKTGVVKKVYLEYPGQDEDEDTLIPIPM